MIDLDALAAELRAAGYDADLHDSPPHLRAWSYADDKPRHTQQINVCDDGEVIIYVTAYPDSSVWQMIDIIRRHVEPRSVDDLRASVIAEAQQLYERFAPYIEDDNQWYRDGRPCDGKDAGVIGEFARDVLAVIGGEAG